MPAGLKLGLATGGFLTPGVALGGDEVPGDGPWGGTAWDSVSAEASLPGFGDAFIKGLPVGFLATQYGEQYSIAKAITLAAPGTAQSVAPAQSIRPAAALAAPVVAETPAPAVAEVKAAETPAPAVAEVKAAEAPGAVVAEAPVPDVKPAVEAPAQKAVSTRGGHEQTAAAGDNAGGNTRAHAGTRGKRNAD